VIVFLDLWDLIVHLLRILVLKINWEIIVHYMEIVQLRRGELIFALVIKDGKEMHVLKLFAAVLAVIMEIAPHLVIVPVGVDGQDQRVIKEFVKAIAQIMEIAMYETTHQAVVVHLVTLELIVLKLILQPLSTRIIFRLFLEWQLEQQPL